MSIQLDLTLWLNRLISHAPIFEGRVFKTVPDTDLNIDEQESPCAFVYVASDKSAGNSQVGGIRQALDTHVVVEILVRRTATRTDKFSEADGDILTECKAQVRDALLGMKQDNYSYPVLHIAGELLKKDKRVLRFTDTYLAQQFLTKRLPAL